MSTIGKPAHSAFSRSCLETSCIPAHSAPWPTRCSGTCRVGRLVPEPELLEVLLHARLGLEVEPLPQRHGRVGRLVGAALDRERQQHDRPPGAALGRCERLRRHSRCRGRPGSCGLRRRLPRAPAPRCGSGCRRRGRATPTGRRELLDRLLDRERARSGHAEAARGEVLRLARRERQRDDEHDEPDTEDEQAAARDEAAEAIHGVLHNGIHSRLWAPRQLFLPPCNSDALHIETGTAPDRAPTSPPRARAPRLPHCPSRTGATQP